MGFKEMAIFCKMTEIFLKPIHFFGKNKANFGNPS